MMLGNQILGKFVIGQGQHLPLWKFWFDKLAIVSLALADPIFHQFLTNPTHLPP